MDTRPIASRTRRGRVTDNRSPRSRAPRRGSTPTFSIVVVSRGDFDALCACVERLEHSCARLEAEIIIVVQGTIADSVSLQKRFTTARVVPAPADAGGGDLRGLGMLEAGGDIVAFTEDCQMRGEEWIAVLERRAKGPDGYGPASNGKIDWVRYLEERGVLSRNGRGA